MMKIAVLSDARYPTKPDGGHGLGMSAHDIATGLADTGNEVTLFALAGSEFEAGELHAIRTEAEAAKYCASRMEFDAVLDTGHHHLLSRMVPDAPVVNRICDMECEYQPPNAIVNSWYMKRFYPDAQLVNTGIADPAYFREESGDYLLYAGKKEKQLGYELAREAARASRMPLRIANGLSGREKWKLFAGAHALIHPSRERAAPRLPIEAGYCGTPTICLAGDGTEHAVIDGVTGYVAEAITDIPMLAQIVYRLDRTRVKAWMVEHHSRGGMLYGYYSALREVSEGAKWKRLSLV